MEEDGRVSEATGTSSALFPSQSADPLHMEEEESMSSPTRGPILNKNPVQPIEVDDLQNPSFSNYSNLVNSIEEGVEEGSNSLNHSSEGGPCYSSDYGPPPLRRPSSPEEDRISALPDCVIHHILSFLPTKDSIKTGILSKRWEKLWSFVPNLRFRVLDDEPQPHKLFRMIDGTLILYSSTKIRKFVLRFDYEMFTREVPKSDMDSFIDLWLRFAARRNVQELCLKFCAKRYLMGKEMLADEDFDRYTMPQFLFDDSSLTKLRSRFCDYVSKGQVSWKSLKVLTIRSAVLTNGMLQRILLGSPVLEELELSDCWDITSVNVISSAPNLKSLGILGHWEGTKCHLLDVSSLIDAHIDFALYEYGVSNNSHDAFMETTNALLQKINHVELLTIGIGCIQALSMAEDRGLPSPFFNCNWKCLTVKTPIVLELNLPGMANFPRMAGLLQNAPNLEKLVVDRTSWFYGSVYFSLIHPTEENFQTSRARSFSCLLRHLKAIELVEPYIDANYPGYLYEFLQFVLQNAMVLEKMVVPSWHYEAARKLLSFPRASPHAVILLSKP
ncbi:hypothetical protein SLEP1_g21553 [Rubroshorea leprosula]|uniref:F-box domain-containing protein n=1 Tax=Rubroshorea leprosula TaxID=152421 RepID=A0AAV5JBP6_9ROSI|nr:hypothetical protein SLEP1_g21553 [Rubroshorea leprosula]